DGSAANAHEPVVFREVVARLADLLAEYGVSIFEPAEDHIQGRFGNGGIATERGHVRLQLVQIFQQVGLEVGSTADIHDLEDGDEGKMMVESRFARHQLPEPRKQVLESEVSANALVEGVFVKYHAVLPR